MMRRSIIRRRALACTIEPLESRQVLSTVSIMPRQVSLPSVTSGHGVVTVVVLGDASLDTSRLDPTSIVLTLNGGSPFHPRRTPHVKNINGDGIHDLVLQFNRSRLKGLTGQVSVDVSGNISGSSSSPTDLGSSTLTVFQPGHKGHGHDQGRQPSHSQVSDKSSHQPSRPGKGQFPSPLQNHHLASANVGSMTTTIAHPPRKPVHAPNRVGTPAVASAAAPYTPTQIRHAYGIDQFAFYGTGQTIAIIDAYDDPTIINDLAVFDQQFGLPAPASFVKATPQGAPVYNSGWATEIALDVEWAHAIAPDAKILLVEAKSASFSDLLSAVDYAVAQGARQVSMSWGGSEFRGQTNYDSHFNHPGVTFLASSGDSGAGVEYPAASPYVTAVGGTTLQLDSNGNRLSEVAWSGSGGGTSTIEARPGFQAGFLSGKRRGVPDVAYNADPNTGFYVYDSSSGGAWWQVGGTSAGAPQWAGLVALVNQGRSSAGKGSLGSGLAYGTNTALYKLAGSTSYTNPYGDFFDITAGSNGHKATVGYDLVTGLGSPVANKLVPDLINKT